MTPAPTGDPMAIILFFGFRTWDEFKQMSGQYGAAGSDELLKDWLERSLHTEARFIKTSDVVTLFTGGISLECQSSPAIDDNGRGVVLSVDSVFRPLPSMLELSAVLDSPGGVSWKVQIEGSNSGVRFEPLAEPAAAGEPARRQPEMYSGFLGGQAPGTAAGADCGPSISIPPGSPVSVPDARRSALFVSPGTISPPTISDSAFTERMRWLRALAPGLSFGECSHHELVKALSDWSAGLGQSGSYLVCVLSPSSLHGIRTMLGQVDPPAFTGEGRELWEALREAEALRQHLSWPNEHGVRLGAESERAVATLFRLDTIGRLREQSRGLATALQKANDPKRSFQLPMTPAMAARQWLLSRRLSRLFSLERRLNCAWRDQIFGDGRARPKEIGERYAKALDTLIEATEGYIGHYGSTTFESDSRRLSLALERLNSELLRQDPAGECREMLPEQLISKKSQLQSVLDRANSRLQAWHSWQKIGNASGASALLRCFRIPHLFLVDREIEGVWDLLAAARPGIIVAESADAAPARISAEVVILLEGKGLKPVAGTITESDEALGELRRALASWRPNDEEIADTFPGLSAVHGRALILNLTGKGQP